MGRIRSTRQQRAWYFYDWANSAYVTTTATVILGPYLTSLAVNAACPGLPSGQVCTTPVSLLRVPVLPGAVTPSEILQAEELGLKSVKFFPANVYGGAAALKSLSAPFGDISFIPTGGVSAANLAEFLVLPCVPAIGGSWMVPAKAVDNGEFDKVETLTRDAMSLVAELTGGHN